ncbi:gliding motility associated protien GldN [Daejeonella rubra]|uniref:Gliding motility associated protien GldN n=1 Tax=Daejeonella rubra TaxID=990371 RepID=A0A1G9U5F3_9SPHI|nr:gliding motility protein GldN [Daejeonella rubra]SDM55141.1 gliding motility associated protien GldN [Daejeonella rubra]
MKKIFFALILIAGTLRLSAQAPNLNNDTKPKPAERPVDGFYQKTNILNARVSPYASLRESDVMFSKRVWREIDLRDKVNMIFASPKSRLITILTDAIQAGELTAYDASSTKDDVNGDEFSVVLKAEEAMARFADSVLVPIFDKDGNQTGTVVTAGEFNPDSIVKFRIKEDWIFDKQRSVFEPRIVGIAPMVRISAAGQAFDEQPAFWIYFPEVRHLLVTKAVVNRSNDATGLSYDDIFMKRVFSSYIVKESNPEDLRIKDYALGIDRLYESERVKKALMDFEHDLWSF